MLRFRGRLKGFDKRTHFEVRPTLFLQSTYCPRNLWRPPVDLGLILSDLSEFDNNAPEPTSEFYRVAVWDASEAFKLKSKVKMLHLKEIFEKDLEIWSKPPGIPWKGLGYKTKDDIRRDHRAVNSVRKFWHFVKRGETLCPPDSCVYVRAQVVERFDVKFHALYDFPATITFGEAVFAIPLINAYKEGDSPIAYGLRKSANGGFTKLRGKMEGKGYCGLNFLKFDKKIPDWLINKAFYILAANIDFLYYEGFGIADVRCTFRMFEYIKHYFINTTIRLPNGKRWQKSSGVASGSYFTQLIGSICNYILLKWFCYETGVKVDNLLVFEDNSIVATSTPIDIHRFSALAKSVGMTINMKKSRISKDF